MEQNWKLFLWFYVQFNEFSFACCIKSDQIRADGACTNDFMLKMIQQSKWICVTIIPVQYFKKCKLVQTNENILRDENSDYLWHHRRHHHQTWFLLSFQWAEEMFKAIRRMSKMKSIDLKWHFDCEFCKKFQFSNLESQSGRLWMELCEPWNSNKTKWNNMKVNESC